MEDQKNEQTQSTNFRADMGPQNRSGQTPFPQFNPKFGSDGNMPFDADIAAKIEASKSNGWGSLFSAFISERKKPILIAITAILLFMGGTYISRNSGENLSEDNVAGITDIKESKENDSEYKSTDETSPNMTNIELDDDGQIIVQEISGPALPEEPALVKKSEPQSDKTGAVIVEKTANAVTVNAESGDGVTHLARRAIKEYLDGNKEALTAEQKIYAEDYVQNRVGNELLEIGQKLSFSTDLMREAVSKAKALEDWQVDNLTKYTLNVSL